MSSVASEIGIKGTEDILNSHRDHGDAVAKNLYLMREIDAIVTKALRENMFTQEVIKLLEALSYNVE